MRTSIADLPCPTPGQTAGGAALAAAIALKRLKGRRVALICSGANITPDQLRALFTVS